MKVVISKSDLEKSLQVVNNTVASGAVDISTHFVFRYTEEDKLEILSYSGRLFSSSFCAGATVTDTDEHTSFTIEAKRLNLWLSAVGDSALTFTFDGKVTKATSPMGSQVFRSLDPSAFPYWDDVVGDAEETATVPANFMKNALSHLKKFVSTDDTKRPSFCVTEAREGLLLAASQGLLSAVGIQDFATDNKLRANGKNVGSIVSYLSIFEDGDISIHEHTNFVLYKAVDGSMLGESRDNHSFPKVALKLDDPTDHQWLIDVSALKNAMVFLKAGAPHEDNRLKFKYRDDSKIQVGMSVAGPDGGDTFVDLQTFAQTKKDDDVDDVEVFELHYKNLDMVLSTIKDDRVNLGVSKKNSSGLVRLDSTVNGNRYVSMLTWMR